jgi:hypothetical protein
MRFFTCAFALFGRSFSFFTCAACAKAKRLLRIAIIAPNRLKLRLYQGQLENRKKRFRDTPRFKFRAVLTNVRDKQIVCNHDLKRKGGAPPRPPPTYPPPLSAARPGRTDRLRKAEEETAACLAFPDVCPEPVLVNLSCFSITKMPRQEALLSFRTRVERGRLQRRQLPAHQLCKKNGVFLSAFPTFVPSLSWQNDHFYIQ